MTSRLSTGPGGPTNGIKKNLSMNANDNASKNGSYNFSKSNFNLNSQIIHGDAPSSSSNAANLLQIDLS